MTWKSQVSRDLATFDIAVYLADVYEDHNAVPVATDEGHVTMQRQRPAQQISPVLRLPWEALEALRDALNDHMPPTDDADLRDALQVERDRVDRFIDAALDR